MPMAVTDGGRRYWRGRGFFSNLLKDASNLLALLFLLLLTAFLMFCVNFHPDHSICREDEQSCDIAELYLRDPFSSTSFTFWTLIRLIYLTLFVLYWLGSFAVSVHESTSAWRIRHFCKLRLGISEDQIKWVTWPELLRRLVLIQRTTRLCLKRDLTEHDVINRIMRKENYLIGMLNKGILNLSLPLWGYKRRRILTKMLEWSLRWGLFDPMFDKNFEIRHRYKSDSLFLTRRLQHLAVVNILLAPFLLVFLVISFLMMNVERFYHQPSSVSERSWSPYARWKMREFNELEHQLERRLGQSLVPAQEYVDQFPHDSLKHLTRLIAFVLESSVALLLCLALIDDSLLESGDLMGHNLVWWAAVLMIGLRIARGIAPNNPTLDPDDCMQRIVQHTHYYPKIWREHCRSKEVQENFQSMFRYTALNFLDEVLSIFLTPYILYFSLPQSSEWIVQFLRQSTVRVEGVGDVCSLAMFDFHRHGNRRYGSSAEGERSERSRQGKLEKSFLTFAASYPSWQPSSEGLHLLRKLGMTSTTQSVPSAEHLKQAIQHSSRYSAIEMTPVSTVKLQEAASSRAHQSTGDASIERGSTPLVTSSTDDLRASHDALQRFYIQNNESVNRSHV